MKKILILSIALSFFIFSGKANPVGKDKNVRTGVKHKQFAVINIEKVTATFSFKGHPNPVAQCYNFGYETQCTNPGSCLQYSVCDDNFSVVWAMHLLQDWYFFQQDCGVN